MKLQTHFASELPELAVEWQAENAPNPQLLVLNESLAEQLGLDREELQSPEGVEFLVGNTLPKDARPVAQVYAGHQFGSYSPRLGDGRALLLGEVTDENGRLCDIHLKGSGKTPFARGGDGLAVLGPMLREFIVSEAMHALGVPTTRSLAVVQTGRAVYRESAEQGALLVRVASSHLRVGTFQYVRNMGDTELLRRLTNFAIERHYPEAASAENPPLELFKRVLSRQATLIARWMLVGFVHGVMNTDNMTISGETIDYGPCAFMEAFDPAAVYSSIDEAGRYAYGRQPLLAEWNLARLAEALLPLFAEEEDAAVQLAQEALGEFSSEYSAAWTAGMRRKLGLPAALTDEDATPLINDLFTLLRERKIDYTSLFRQLGAAARGNTVAVRLMFSMSADFDAWLERWREHEPDADLMDRTNPAYIPRNHLVEAALSAANTGDMQPVGALLEAVTHPFDERADLDRYASPAPEDFGPYRTYCGT